LKITKYISLLFLLVFGFFVQAQEKEELIKQLSNTTEDTTKLRLLVEVSDICEISEIENYASQAVELSNKLLAKKKGNKKQILINKATGLNNLGFFHHNYSQIEKAIEKYKLALSIFKEIKDTNGVIMANNNIAMLEKDIGHIDLTIQYLDKALELGLLTDNQQMLQLTYTNYSAIYSRMGMINKAIENAFKGLEIQEKIGDDYGKGYAINNIASLYYNQKDLIKAEEYFLKSLEIRKKINDEYGVTTAYNNLAIIYDDLGRDSLALEYYYKCLERRIKIKNEEGIAQSYSNLGSFFFKGKQNDKAFEYFSKAIEIRERITDKEGLSNSYQKMSNFLKSQNKIKEAEKYGALSLKYAQELSFNEDIKNSAEVLTLIYERQGNYKKALEMNRLYFYMKDSLFNKETQKSIITQQINYDYNKKKLTDSLFFAKGQEVKDLALAKQDAQLQKEKTQRLALYGGLFIIILFAGFVYSRFRVSQQQKLIIENQKNIVEEKNREILGSINYAKRIQSAILPSDKIVKECFNDSFIFYKPKDIVAGDFYWVEHKDGKTLFAAADCTGHGVPGAMVSVICNNGLNRAVREYGITDPGKILDKTREIVIQEFEKSEDDVRDGMDIALCSLEGNQLCYAGAHNPLWIIRGGELMETKANKQPIGEFENKESYTTHTFELEKGDSIYIFSDGFVDQFGGEKGKKFKTANLKKMLISIQNESMQTQKQILEDVFNEWKGKMEQVDDVCLLGVRV
jgi:serine phosphatase RsbU (regulator of sigma subunit)